LIATNVRKKYGYMVKKMRILTVTDSLGMPREVVSIEETWPGKFVSLSREKNIEVYTHCRRALSAKDVTAEEIMEYKPNVVIFQIGIVDVCRRVLTRREQWIWSKIPVLGGAVHKFCHAHHYFMTKLRNKHVADVTTLRNLMAKVADQVDRVLWICVAPPGKELSDITYNVDKDIKVYNSYIEKTMSEKIVIVNPYANNNMETILLPDGYHLTVEGNDVVFHKLIEILNKEQIDGFYNQST